MEMEFSDGGRRRRRLLLLLGILLAVVAAGLVLSSGSRPTDQGTAPEPVPTRRIIVAAAEIPARTVIDPSMLAARTVPDDPSFLSAIEDPALVTGRVTAVPIAAGQPIALNLIETGDATAPFSILAPTETISPYSPVWRAVSLSVPRERAVAGKVEAGQRVDVIASIKIRILVEDPTGALVDGTTDEGFTSGMSTKVVFQDIEVLAAEPDAGAYVLKAELHQAEEMMALVAEDSSPVTFSFVLRPEGDNRVVDRDGYGETLDRILNRYGNPLPQVIDIDRYPRIPERTLEETPSPAFAPGQSPEPTPAASPAA